MHQRTGYGRPLRVLHLITSLHIGGAGRLLVRTVGGLNPSQIESQVGYFLPRRELVPELESIGIEPVFLNHGGAAQGIRTLRRLLDLLDRFRPDVVHTNLALDRIYGSLAARMQRVPLVTSLHTTVEPRGTGGPNSRSVAISHAETYLSRRLSARFVAVGAEVAESHVRRLGFDRARIRVIVPGIPAEWFEASTPQTPSATREQLGITGRPVIVNAARLHPVKAQAVLISSMPRVLRSYPEAQLVIAGDGELRARLEEKVQELGLRDHVLMPGMVRDVRSLLATADVYATASQVEGRSIALLEAMAVGVPIVASDIPVHREVLRDGETGLLSPVGDPERLGERIVEMLQQPDPASFGRRARQEVRTQSTMAEWNRQLEELYSEVARPPTQ